MAVPSVSQWSGSLGFCHWIPYLLQHRPSWPSVSTAPLHRSKSGRHSLVSNGASRAVLARSQKISKVLQHFSRDTAYLASHFNRASSSRLFELQKPMVDYSREIKNICDQLSSIGNTVSEHNENTCCFAQVRKRLWANQNKYWRLHGCSQLLRS